MSYRFRDFKKEIKRNANPEKAKILQRFFKTGKGEYREGDIFLGIVVPKQREIAKKYFKLELPDLQKLIKSKIHEERLIALLIAVNQFEKGRLQQKKKIFEFYLNNTKFINNWDLIDLTADKIVGAYLFDKDRSILTSLAHSKSIWERRMAIMATFNYIKKADCNETLKIAKTLLNDKHDLIHKAVGWMLREVGKRCGIDIEEDFLKLHYKKMPRTMLRYAIEKFPEEKRKKYLKGDI